MHCYDNDGLFFKRLLAFSNLRLFGFNLSHIWPMELNLDFFKQISPSK